MNEKITWTATPEQMRTLEKAANILNCTSWCKKDNTAQSVFAEFVEPLVSCMLDDWPNLAENIWNGIDTGEDETGARHEAKVKELRANFLNAALHTGVDA